MRYPVNGYGLRQPKQKIPRRRKSATGVDGRKAMPTASLAAPTQTAKTAAFPLCMNRSQAARMLGHSYDWLLRQAADHELYRPDRKAPGRQAVYSGRRVELIAMVETGEISSADKALAKLIQEKASRQGREIAEAKRKGGA
jgi:hypothetical protein